MKSIRWKLVIMYIALVFIVMITCGTFIIYNIRNNEDIKAKRELRRMADKIFNYVIKDKPEDMFLENYASYKQVISLPLGMDAFVIRSFDGVTIVSSTEDFPQFTNSVVIVARDGKEGFSSGRRYSASQDERYIPWVELGCPVTNTDEGNSYVIYVRKDATDIFDNRAKTTRTIAVAALIALSASALIGVFFANTLTVPISILTKKTKEFASGKVTEPINVASMDEIGQLTDSFNNMAKDLTNTLSEMKKEKNKMEIVLYNMSDGVLAYDGSGKNIHANNVSAEMLNMTRQEIEEMSLKEMLGKLGSDTHSQNAEMDWEDIKDSSIEVGDRYVHFNITPYRNNEGKAEGVVIVLQDITKHIKLDNLRREFVANVSHEIRTPITTIKSYAETLMDEANPETTMNFLEIINNEADRMTLLVTDLLDLSRLDSGKMDLNIKEVDLVELVRQSVTRHMVTAEREGKKISFETSVDEILIKLDPERINQVLNNIITNSLRYSYENAVVNVKIEVFDNCYRVYVRDNGIGIPKEDLRRIFERFYRVDKARSRSLGGTGLGLSIAKEIMEAHGGRISASSEVGKGTVMALRFPRKLLKDAIILNRNEHNTVKKEAEGEQD